ncbi:MAG: histidine phosphatase family protein, partial [Nocardioides sp.]
RPLMGVVLLVRHGQASWGAADYDVLSTLGEEQAQLVGAALASRTPTPGAVVHGAMVRQRRSAEIAASGAGWGVGLTEDGDWDEMDHEAVLSALPAPFEGRDPTRAEFQHWFEAATGRWLGGEHDHDYHESFTAFTARVERALARAVERAQDSGSVVVFTSGGPIAWVTASLTGGGATAHGRLAPVVVNTSISTVVAGRRGATFLTFNEHTHLDAAHLTYR